MNLKKYFIECAGIHGYEGDGETLHAFVRRHEGIKIEYHKLSREAK
jgi:hypothetical protein